MLSSNQINQYWKFLRTGLIFAQSHAVFVFVKMVFLRTKQGVLFCWPRVPTKQKIQSLESCSLVEPVICCFVFVFVVGKGWPKCEKRNSLHLYDKIVAPKTSFDSNNFGMREYLL